LFAPILLLAHYSFVWLLFFCFQPNEE